jgi:hypothetical protein
LSPVNRLTFPVSGLAIKVLQLTILIVVQAFLNESSKKLGFNEAENE